MARRFHVTSAALLLCMGGCTQDPFERSGTWQPPGANDRNLREMVTAPSHLGRGVAASTERGAAGSNAVTRLLTEQRRPLPVLRTSKIDGGDQQPGSQPLPGLGIAPKGGASP